MKVESSTGVSTEILAVISTSATKEESNAHLSLGCGWCLQTIGELLNSTGWQVVWNFVEVSFDFNVRHRG